MCAAGIKTYMIGYSTRALVTAALIWKNKQLQYEPVREKTNNLGSDQVRHKPGCTVTEEG